MKARVLVVEDDLDLRASLTEVLRASGYDARAVGSGSEAILLLESGCTVDLILSDYLMHNGNGLELFLYVKARGSRPPCFFMMTGQAEVQMEEAKRMGVQEFLLKPFDIPDLLGLIEKHVSLTERPTPRLLH